jgi:putative transposase
MFDTMLREIGERASGADHVRILLSMPPKCSESNVMGFIKGKSAIHIARVHAGRRWNFIGQHFRA